jgi:protein AFG1
MILQRLFGMLWQAGTVVVATSNREPTALYEGGINRSRFLPFVDLLQQHMRVVALPGEHDYRQNDNNESIDAIPLDQENQPMPHQQQRPRYFWPSDSAATRRAVQQYLDDERANGHTLQSQEISIHPQGRRTLVVQRAVGTVAHMDFDELCDRPLGAADYFALCRSFRTLILDHVPPLNASNFNQARRFVTLVDALYESRTRLILAAAVPADALLGHFDAVLVESQDAGDEGLQTTDAAPVVVAETAVTATGGASSAHATTFLHDPHSQTTVEWTATGRVGVSLAQLSAVRDVAFSLARARSRLAEMRRPKWGETKETVR